MKTKENRPIREENRPTKKDLVDRLCVMWDKIEGWKEEGGLEAAGAIETPTANPIGLPPLFAIDEADQYLRRNPNLLGKYGKTTGLAFVKSNMAERFRELECNFLETGEPEITKDNIMMIPGINSGLALLYQTLSKKTPAEPEKKVAVLTTQFFYSIPNPPNVEFHRIPVDMVAGQEISTNALEEKINQLREKGYDHIIYYNCNPDNPSGRLMSKEKTDEITYFLKQKRYDNLIVVNDFAYNGTQFDETKKATAISGEGINSVTFLGMSKIGAPGFRIAALAAKKDLIDDISATAFENYIFPSIHSQLCMNSFFSDENKEKREAYLAEKSLQYKNNSKLFRILVNGIDDKKNPEELPIFASKIANVLKISEEDAYQMMRNGIKGAKVINNPEATFFSIVDFSDLCATPYRGMTLSTGMDIAEAVFEESRIFMLPLDLMTLGNDSEKLSETCFAMRFSHSIPEEEVIKTCAQLNNCLKAMIPEVSLKPSGSEAKEEYSAKAREAEPLKSMTNEHSP